MIAFKALIFDLDGTLIDSLQDIADAMNRVLTARKLPPHSYADYKEFVGRGLKNLVERCLPAKLLDPEILEACYNELIRDYREHYVVKTHLYPGIRELLEQISLKYAGQQKAQTAGGGRLFPLAVLSNKADEITQLIARQLGLTDYFDLILGATPRFPRKPDIQSSLYIAEQLGCQPAEMLYIGDSGVDMQTAKKAGMTAVGVTWGFRSRQELLDNRADYVVDTPAEILEILRKSLLS
jgi:phosphoglycolate phosphatase